MKLHNVQIQYIIYDLKEIYPKLMDLNLSLQAFSLRFKCTIMIKRYLRSVVSRPSLTFNIDWNFNYVG